MPRFRTKRKKLRSRFFTMKGGGLEDEVKEAVVEGVKAILPAGATLDTEQIEEKIEKVEKVVIQDVKAVLPAGATFDTMLSDEQIGDIFGRLKADPRLANFNLDAVEEQVEKELNAEAMVGGAHYFGQKKQNTKRARKEAARKRKEAEKEQVRMKQLVEGISEARWQPTEGQMAEVRNAFPIYERGERRQKFLNTHRGSKFIHPRYYNVLAGTDPANLNRPIPKLAKTQKKGRREVYRGISYRRTGNFLAFLIILLMASTASAVGVGEQAMDSVSPAAIPTPLASASASATGNNISTQEKKVKYLKIYAASAKTTANAYRQRADKPGATAKQKIDAAVASSGAEHADSLAKAAASQLAAAKASSMTSPAVSASPSTTGTVSRSATSLKSSSVAASSSPTGTASRSAAASPAISSPAATGAVSPLAAASASRSATSSKSSSVAVSPSPTGAAASPSVASKSSSVTVSPSPTGAASPSPTGTASSSVAAGAGGGGGGAATSSVVPKATSSLVPSKPPVPSSASTPTTTPIPEPQNNQQNKSFNKVEVVHLEDYFNVTMVNSVVNQHPSLKARQPTFIGTNFPYAHVVWRTSNSPLIYFTELQRLHYILTYYHKLAEYLALNWYLYKPGVIDVKRDISVACLDSYHCVASVNVKNTYSLWFANWMEKGINNYIGDQTEPNEYFKESDNVYGIKENYSSDHKIIPGILMIKENHVNKFIQAVKDESGDPTLNPYIVSELYPNAPANDNYYIVVYRDVRQPTFHPMLPSPDRILYKPLSLEVQRRVLEKPEYLPRKINFEPPSQLFSISGPNASPLPTGNSSNSPTATPAGRQGSSLIPIGNSSNSPTATPAGRQGSSLIPTGNSSNSASQSRAPTYSLDLTKNPPYEVVIVKDVRGKNVSALNFGSGIVTFSPNVPGTRPVAVIVQQGSVLEKQVLYVGGELPPALIMFRNPDNNAVVTFETPTLYINGNTGEVVSADHPDAMPVDSFGNPVAPNNMIFNGTKMSEIVGNRSVPDATKQTYKDHNITNANSSEADVNQYFFNYPMGKGQVPIGTSPTESSENWLGTIQIWYTSKFKDLITLITRGSIDQLEVITRFQGGNVTMRDNLIKATEIYKLCTQGRCDPSNPEELFYFSAQEELAVALSRDTANARKELAKIGVAKFLTIALALFLQAPVTLFVGTGSIIYLIYYLSILLKQGIQSIYADASSNISTKKFQMTNELTMWDADKTRDQRIINNYRKLSTDSKIKGINRTKINEYLPKLENEFNNLYSEQIKQRYIKAIREYERLGYSNSSFFNKTKYPIAIIKLINALRDRTKIRKAFMKITIDEMPQIVR
jgi:hypothetical protein